MSQQGKSQSIYNFWIENSKPSNGLRNARHVVKIKPSKRDNALIDLDDPYFTLIVVKRVKTKLKAQRRVYNTTVREVYADHCKANPDLTCSSTLFYRC